MPTEESGISVFIVDNDPLVRRGLTSLLEESANIYVSCGPAAPDSALRKISDRRPSVVLITFTYLREIGLGYLNQIKEVDERIRSVVTGGPITEKSLLSIVEAGAFAYIASDATLEKFEYVIEEAVSSDRRVLPEIASEVLFHALSKSESGRVGYNLTRREREVLNHIARGMSNKEIAAALFVSVGTVKAHVSNILRKMGAADRTQAIIKAMKEGLIDNFEGI